MRAGDTYIRAGRNVKTDPHLWVVISDPAKDRSRLVVVNITTQRIGKDQSCVIYPGEHDFVKNESVVLYAGARIVPESAIQAAANAGLLKFLKPVTKALLTRIREGAEKTPNIPLTARRILQSQGVISLET